MGARISNNGLVAKLRVDGAWFVEGSSSNIQLTKEFGRKNKKIISFLLQRQTNGKYYIEPVTYEFHSKLSHFDYCMPESRWSREKRFFKNIYALLQRTDTLQYVENADSFIKINNHNKKSDKGSVRGQLKSFIKPVPNNKK